MEPLKNILSSILLLPIVFYFLLTTLPSQASELNTSFLRFWGIRDNDIFNLNSGNVGIGIADPLGKLEVADGMFRVSGSTYRGVQVNIKPQTGDNIGIGFYGESTVGVEMSSYSEFRASPAVSSTGKVRDLFGFLSTPQVYGEVTNLYGVYSSAFGATNNWAGYFNGGDVFVRDNLGVGTDTPASKLTVSGGYFQFTQSGYSAPSVSDCSSDDQLGRLYLDVDAHRLFICHGADRSWDYLDLSD